MQNGYVGEELQRRHADELNETLFLTLGQARDIVAGWVEDYNTPTPAFLARIRHTSGLRRRSRLARGCSAPRSWKLRSAAPCSTSAAARQQHPASGPGWMKNGGSVSMDEMYLNQVRLLLRVLPFVAKGESLALKGGTAINLFERDLPRLSVDIDLTYLLFDERATALENISAALTRIKDRIEQRLPDVRATLVEQSGRRRSEAALPVSKSANQNRSEHRHARSHIQTRVMACSEKVQDMFGSFAEIAVVSHAELYGGKLCAHSIASTRATCSTFTIC